MRHLLTLLELSPEEFRRIFALTKELKDKLQEGIREPVLPGRVQALLFEKPSLRTRVSFEAAMAHLGGTTLFFGQDVGWQKRESANDFAQVLSQYVGVVICRACCRRLIREKQLPARSAFIPMCGPAWVRKPRRMRDARLSPAFK